MKAVPRIELPVTPHTRHLVPETRGFWLFFAVDGKKILPFVAKKMWISQQFAQILENAGNFRDEKNIIV